MRRSGEGEKGRYLPWSKEEEGAYIFEWNKCLWQHSRLLRRQGRIWIIQYLIVVFHILILSLYNEIYFLPGWQENWDQQIKNKLHEIHSLFGKTSYFYCKRNRWSWPECRIGHGRLTHSYSFIDFAPFLRFFYLIETCSIFYLFISILIKASVVCFFPVKIATSHKTLLFYLSLGVLYISL